MFGIEDRVVRKIIRAANIFDFSLLIPYWLQYKTICIVC